MSLFEKKHAAIVRKQKRIATVTIDNTYITFQLKKKSVLRAYCNGHIGLSFQLFCRKCVGILEGSSWEMMTI